MINEQTTLLEEKKQFDLKRFLKKNAFAWLLVTPVVLGILFFTLVPMITSLIYAFHDYMPNKFLESEKLSNLGLQHFKTIFTFLSFFNTSFHYTSTQHITLSFKLMFQYLCT